MTKRQQIDTGQRFGRLVVISKSDKKIQRGSTGGYYYLCKCDCGKEAFAIGSFLKNGQKKSCGCLSIDIFVNRNKKEPGVAAYNKLYLQIQQKAEERNLEFNLNKDQHKELISGNCYYCGEPPKRYNPYINIQSNTVSFNKTRTQLKPETIERSWININTVDRLDNNIGYLIDNCVAACWFCNKMKCDKTLEDFLNQINKINKFQKKVA